MLETNAYKSAPAKTKKRIYPLTITFAGRVPENSTVSSIYHLYQEALCIFSLQDQQWACWGYIQTLGVLRVCGGFPGAGGGGESS
jgi:hypothetical protein